ncbi:MAG: rod shape-determining protein [Duncaniella sp.]|nr:rod shape-determining protein [Duncaniella sp.]
MEDKYIVALEIGSSKIKGAIGLVDASGALSVKTVEEERLSDSVRYGCIRNILETTTAIRNVINRLEQREPQRKITGVYISVGGRSLMSQDIEVERILPSEMEITNELIVDITTEALSQQLHERTIVGVSPKEFRVDNLPTKSVVGTYGSRITARLNLISCRTILMRNLNVVLDDRLHLTINDVFVRPLVEADLVIYPEEKRQGCMLVDCGAETTTVAIYRNGVLNYLSTIPMGSRNITRDLAALNYLEERAEELKIEGGSAIVSRDPMAFSHNNSGNADFTQINNYVAARAGEIIANINEQIKFAGLTPDKLPAGIILVGGGSKLQGFDRRLQNMTGMKVRYGSTDNRIRILDGRIKASDDVDIIAVLAAAAKDPDVCVCMERIMPEYYNSTSQSHTNTQPEPMREQSHTYGQSAARPYHAPQPANNNGYQQQGQQSYQQKNQPYQQQQSGQSYQQQPAAAHPHQAYMPQQPETPYGGAYQQPQPPQQAPQGQPYQTQQSQQPQTSYQQPAQGQPYQQPQPSQQATQGQPYQPQGAYPYQAGQQPYQAPTYDNPYREQARNITAATPDEQPAEPQYTGRRKGGLKGIWGNIRTSVINLMTEPEEDDGDNDN